MFIDASAIIAILNREAGYEKLAECIDQATGGVRFSPIVRFEAVVGLARARSRGAAARPVRERLWAVQCSIVSLLCNSFQPFEVRGETEDSAG
jgi:ribonuclease VapC